MDSKAWRRPSCDHVGALMASSWCAHHAQSLLCPGCSAPPAIKPVGRGEGEVEQVVFLAQLVDEPLVPGLDFKESLHLGLEDDRPPTERGKKDLT
eukprot:scaffold272518_cov30-Tisochrysis_lutea.AAC.1